MHLCTEFMKCVRSQVVTGIDYKAILDSGLEIVLVLSSGFVVGWLFELPFSLTSVASIFSSLKSRGV